MKKRILLWVGLVAAVVIVAWGQTATINGVQVMRAVSSTPANGQAPIWNSTLKRWDPGSAGGGSAPVGTVVNTNTTLANSVPLLGTDKTNVTPSQVTITAGTNLLAGTLTATGSVTAASVSISGNSAATYVGITNYLTFALSDMTTALTTGTNKNYWIPKNACTVKYVRANVTTVSSSGLPTFDILKNGVSILSTTLTIDASERSSDTAATAAVISTSAIAADDYVNFSITGAGTSAAGAQVEIGYTVP